MVSSFQKSKNMVTKNRKISFTKHCNLASYNPKGHLKVKDLSYKKRVHSDYGHIQKYMCKVQITSFSPSYRKGKLFERPTPPLPSLPRHLHRLQP